MLNLYKNFLYFKTCQQIIVIGTLSSAGKIGNIIREQVAEHKAGVSITNENKFCFNLENEWAQNQNVMVMVGNNINQLEEKIKKNSDSLFLAFEQRAREFLKKDQQEQEK